MQLRRCSVLWLEPRELAHFELGGLLAGGTGVVSRMQWFAHAPHLAGAVAVEPEDVLLLGNLGPLDWIEAESLRERPGEDWVQGMLQAGLLVGDDEAWRGRREAGEAFRVQPGPGLAGVGHVSTRWQGLDAIREATEEGLDTAEALRAGFGLPPP